MFILPPTGLCHPGRTHHTAPSPRSTPLKVPAYQNTRCHNAEDYNMAIRRHVDIRPHNITNLLRTE